MKYILLIGLWISTLICYSQEYAVEKVLLKETVDNTYVSEIPRLKDNSNESNPVVERINSQILHRFMINSFAQNELEEFRWYEVGYSFEIKNYILYISFTGEYYGAYPNYISDEFFFDLQSGELLKPSVIPFQALFTLPGYLDFLNKHWLEGVKNEFITAVECAEFEPYCSYYDIDAYRVNDNKFIVSLTNDCYPHVAQGCSPVYEVSVELDSMKSYLNNIGNYILSESDYMTMSPIDKYSENEKLKEKIPKNLFLFGEIADRYPFSMAINIDNTEQIYGLYYYDSKLQNINLNGQSNDSTMSLVESISNQPSGFFELYINIDYCPIEGKWLNSEKTKSLEVKFTKVVLCKNN